MGKASRGQLGQICLNRLPTELSSLSIEANGLTLLGDRPKDPYCDCNWDIPLPRFAKQPLCDDAPSAAVATPPEESKATPEATSEDASGTSAKPPDVTVAQRGFVAELPKLRRPAGEPTFTG